MHEKGSSPLWDILTCYCVHSQEMPMYNIFLFTCSFAHLSIKPKVEKQEEGTPPRKGTVYGRIAWIHQHNQ